MSYTKTNDKEMPPGFKGYCGDCAVWEHGQPLNLQRLGIVVASNTRYGLCKARPPLCDRRGAKGFFPVTGEDDWCFGFVLSDTSIVAGD